MEIDDLAYRYEDISHLEYPQRYLAAKKEFSTLSSTVDERVPVPGEYYKYQEEVNRLLQHYDRLLMRWDPGVGKTCGMTAASEWWHRHADKGGHIKHCYVVVRSKLLKEETRNQIVCRCTDRLYTTVGPQANTQRKVNLAISKNLSVWWTIKTLEAFAANLVRETNESLIETYSNSIIVIDEVQNLIVEDVNMVTLMEQINSYVPPEIPTEGRKLKITKDQIFFQMMRLTHLPKAIKVILMTATPMLNSPNEVVSVMNILLPTEQIMTGNLSSYTEEQLLNIFKGRVSRIRQAVTGVKVQRNGRVLPYIFRMADGRVINSQFPVVPVVMEGLQAVTYEEAVINPGAFKRSKNADKERRASAVRLLEQEAATWVYPNLEEEVGLLGKHGLKENLIDGQRLKDNYMNGVPTEEFRYALTHQLREMSAVINQIITSTLTLPGIDWIYLKYVPATAATKFALNLRGVEIYNPSSSEFVSEGIQQIGYCLQKDSRSRKLRPGLVPRPRVVLIDKNFIGNVAKRNWTMELLNSPENRNGEYIKYVIGTPLSKEGISLFNVRRSHYTPAWNRSITTQAEGRANRGAPGFEALLEEQRRQGNPNPTITTEINAYAAVLDLEAFNRAPIMVEVPRGATLTPQGLGINTGSVDLDMYLTSEVKDIEIKYIERLMDRASVDCPIQYLKNSPNPEARDGSPECAYDVCSYTCMDGSVRDIFGTDESSYLALYYEPAVKILIPLLKSIFGKINEIRFSDLILLLRKMADHDIVNERFLVLTLIEFFRNRYPITNSFNLPNYLYLVGDRVFVANTFEEDGSLASSYYSNGLLAVGKNSLEKFIEEKEQPSREEAKQAFMRATNVTEAATLMRDLSDGDRVSLFESVIVELVNNRPLTQAWQNVIYQTYRKYLYVFAEPQEEMHKYEVFLAKRGTKRGHPVKNKSLIEVRDIYPVDFTGFIFQTDTPPVYVHRLAQRLQAWKVPDSSNVVVRFLRDEQGLRIFKPSEGRGFRDPSNLERPAYASLIWMEVAKQLAPYAASPVYGIILEPDLKFRIVDKFPVIKKAKTKDRREDIRGHECSTLGTRRLLEDLWALSLMPDTVRSIAVPSMPEVRTYLQRYREFQTPDIPDDKAIFFYRWLFADYPKPTICATLQEYLEQHKLIFRE